MQEKIQTNRSEFFKDKVYTQLLTIFVLCFVFLIMSLAMYRALVLRPGEVYFKTDDSVSVFLTVSNKDPLGLSKADINYWASQTTAELFDVNYINITNQIEMKANNFDELGWQRFKRLLVDNKLLGPVVNDRQVMHGTPSGVPVLSSSGIVNGVYRWSVLVPLQISYSGKGRYPTKKSMKLAIEIARTNINQESPQGIVIHNIQLVSESGKKA
ncbi:MAG: DotI/IcmL family type IV secretion protein [Pseudomonadota bacterium]|nr:DotI/IcmL family type IV secretion protein [Pseudomonadota bacterium]